MMTLCCDRTARAALAGMLASLLTLLWLPVSAETESRSQAYEFDIPRTSRVLALDELSRQAGLLLGYLSNSAEEEEMLVGPLKGRLDVEAALRVILRSSMLTFRWVDDTMLSVEPLKRPPGAPNLNGDGIIRTRPHSTEFDPTQLDIPEEVLVLGWPMRDLTLAVSPVVVVEREHLDAIGAPTLPDALRYLSQSAYTRPEGYRTSGAQYAEMRGLGPDTALILINGRRALPSTNSISSSAFDLNTVPMTAVERIEFLLDSAAAAYGTDAIGGVINIVLRDRVARPMLEARLGGAEGGARQERLTFLGGVNKDRFYGALVLDYFDLGGLLGGDRDLWRNQDYSRFSGGKDYRALDSNPGNITALNGNLPGLTASLASVPSMDATAGVSREDFLSTAGQPNLESLLRYSSVVPEATRLTATAMATAQINSSLTASAELLYTDRDSTYFFTPPVLPGMPVPQSNAFNPFGTTVRAHRLLSSEYDAQYQFVESDLFRSVLALHGDWGTWDWEVSGLHSKEEATTWLQNALDMRVAVPAALASSNAASALNPFSPGPVGSRALLDSLIAPRDVDQFSSEGTQFAAFVQGPIHPLPAGPLSTVIGGEWRNEAVNVSNEASSFDRGRDVIAGFAQLRVPLLSDRMKVPAVHELTLTGGARWDEYSDFGHVLRLQAGALWKPHRYFSVRASGGRSFRPPSLYELYLPQISTIARVNDPARNEPASITFTMGGNSELRPSTAESFTTGVLFSPDTAMNWKISADYWRVIMDERVVSLPLPVLLAHEEQFASRIHRDAPTEPGRPGILRAVDTSRINAGGVKATGVDVAIKADFQTSAGRFTPELQVTWFDDFLATDIPGQSALDRVNLASELGTILEWRAILGLKWKRGPFGAAAFARHTPSYDDAVAGVRAQHTVAAQTLFDLQGSLDFGMLLGSTASLHGFKLWFGATNLLNEEPNFAQVGDIVGFDTSQADLKQRSYYLRLDKKF